MRNTEWAGNTASTMLFSSLAVARSRPNGFSITTRRHGVCPPVLSDTGSAGPGSESPDRFSCCTTVEKNFGGIDR